MDDSVDALFELPPSEFTAARNALVKQLRAEKRKDEADEVKTLRRPSVPAWAINQVARSSGDTVERLIEAGAAVGAAQRRALSGVRDAGLREASAQRRELVDALWQAAAQVLRSAGTDPAPHRQAVAATLEAASVDPAAADLVRKGRLSAELPAPSGFGDVAGFALVPEASEPPPDAGADAQAAPAPEADDAASRAALAEAQREARRAQQRADELAERAAQARRMALRSADEAERLERRAVQARGRAQEEDAQAEELAASAQAAQKEARAAADHAEQAAAAVPESGRTS